MIYQEIWQVAHDKGLTAKIETTGRTPWQSFGARLYVEVRDNEDGRFIKGFDKFLQDVKIDYESKRIHRAEFDDVSKDIAKYIKDKMKIEQGGWSVPATRRRITVPLPRGVRRGGKTAEFQNSASA